MTGNKNAWRAPLAGLASLAMIATMGVAATTANAAWIHKPVTDDNAVTFNVGTDDSQVSLPVTSVKDSADGSQDGFVSDVYKYRASRRGYTFTGWYTSPAAGGEAVAPTVEAGTTLYAHWTANSESSEVRFHDAVKYGVYQEAIASDDSGRYVAQVEGNDYVVPLAKNDKLAEWQVPADKPGDGKYLTWRTSPNGSTAFDRATAKAGDEFYVDLNRSTVTVTFAPNVSDGSSQLTFDSYSGISTDTRTLDIPSWSKLAEPVAYYDFNAGDQSAKIVSTWRDAAGEVYDFSKPVTKNVTLAASTADAQNGKIVFVYGTAADVFGRVQKSLAVLDGQSINETGRLATPSKYGYTFKGWYNDWAYPRHQFDAAWLAESTNFADLDGSPAPDAIYAGFAPTKAVTKTITYDPYYDGATRTKVTYNLGDQIQRPANPTRDGYKFRGWYLDSTLNSSASWLFGTYVNDDLDITLYAKWEAVTGQSKYDSVIGFPRVNKNNPLASGSYKSFTAKSWADYVDAYNAVDKKLQNKQDQQGKVTDADYAEYAAELADAQKKLVPAETSPVYRIYDQTKPNKSDNKHLYTTDEAERAGRLAAGWRDEGIAFYSVAESRVNAAGIRNGFYKPVYRLYDKPANRHFYTADSAERDRLTANGWRDEGIAWYYKDGTTPVYRAYSPTRYEHLFTTDAKEYKKVTSQPKTAENWYRAEGVAFSVD